MLYSIKCSLFVFSLISQILHGEWDIASVSSPSRRCQTFCPLEPREKWLKRRTAIKIKVTTYSSSIVFYCGKNKFCFSHVVRKMLNYEIICLLKSYTLCLSFDWKYLRISLTGKRPSHSVHHSQFTAVIPHLSTRLRTVPTNSKVFLRGLLDKREKQISTSVIEPKRKLV